MRIIYLHQYFNTPAKSGGTRSYEMARRWAAAGHDVQLITSLRGAHGRVKGWFVEEIDGITVHWLSVPYSNKMGFRQRLQAFFRYALAAGRRANKVGGDVIFATSTPLTIAIPGVYASKRLGVPMVFEVRDLWPELPIALGALRNPFAIYMARWLERFAYRHAEQIVALSPGMEAGVMSTGYPSRKVFVVPNSSDIELFRVPQLAGHRFLEAHPYLKGGPLVVYTGTLGLVNGVAYLVEIAQAMMQIDPTIRFLIVGDGQEEDLIRQKARELGVLETNLWMIPPLPKSEMPDVLSAATLATSFVVDLPELWNNSANKFFDALAAGRPIMINYQGWQADLIRENGVGIVVSPHDPQMAAEILHGFVTNDEEIRKASKAAGELAESQFSRDNLAKQLLEVLKRSLH